VGVLPDAPAFAPSYGSAGQFAGMWLNPNSRGSRLRIWQPWGCNSLHAHHFTATGFSGNSRPRRLKIAEPSGCFAVRDSEPDHLGNRLARLGKSIPGSPTNLRQGYGLASRRVVHREQQTDSTQTRTALGVQVSPRRPIWNVHRPSVPGLGANECVPSGKWCKSTAFRQLLTVTVRRVVQREPSVLYTESH
jgi:hypothetical protein